MSRGRDGLGPKCPVTAAVCSAVARLVCFKYDVAKVKTTDIGPRKYMRIFQFNVGSR